MADVVTRIYRRCAHCGAALPRLGYIGETNPDGCRSLRCRQRTTAKRSAQAVTDLNTIALALGRLVFHHTLTVGSCIALLFGGCESHYTCGSLDSGLAETLNHSPFCADAQIDSGARR